MSSHHKTWEVYAFLALIAVIAVIAMRYPAITGMAVLDLGDADIDPELIEQMIVNDTADVIILLEEPDEKHIKGNSKKEKLKNKKQEIDEIQDEVLSSLDQKKAKSNKTRIFGSNKPDIKLKHRFE
ncbi:hypothetical protein ACFL96_09430, partial [Thermoproteota archaeon]